ncbi:hypothetical protein PENDEC_c002G02637 [Penicillium decumbens]|uniref:Uncharacterized protein n=1 Tax=Penicillium decumbens TaxID=69771 RepID=A0A1V6PLJ5_PENDC|nr:hypothetical protein PENDEC_c002G02637 [Penicillium decumbens]
MEPGQSNALASGKAKVSDADDPMTDIYTVEAPNLSLTKAPSKLTESLTMALNNTTAVTIDELIADELIQSILEKTKLAAAICADIQQVAQNIHKLREADQSIHRFSQTVNIERLLYHKERLDILATALREQSISIEQRFPTIKTTPERLVRDWYAAIADSWQAGMELKDELDAIAMEEITHGLGRI